MLKKLLPLSLAPVLLWPMSLAAEPKSTDTMATLTKTIETQMEKYEPQDILVCLDVDMTLTATSEVAAQWPSLKKYSSAFKEITKNLNPLQINTLLNLSTKTQPPMLIEEKTPDIIASLTQKGVKVIALTDAMTGSLGDIDDLQKWRLDSLTKLGIRFDGSFPEHADLKFPELTQQSGRHPVFAQGVLFTDSGGKNELDKGSVLVQFLKTLNYIPKVVIFMDDRVKYIDVVEKALVAYDPSIQFIGFEYKGGHKFATGNISEQDFRTFWEDLAKKAKEAA